MLWYRSVLTQSTKGGTPLISSEKLAQNVLGTLSIDISGFWVVPPLVSMVFNGLGPLLE